MTNSTHDPYSDPMEDYAGGPVVGNDGNFLADADDDDAEILDSLVEQEAEPPSAEDLPVVRIDMRPIPKDLPPPRTYMRGRTAHLEQDVPILLAAGSPWRKRILIGTNITTSFTVGHTRTEVDDLLTSYRAVTTGTVTLELFTNADVWVKPGARAQYTYFEEFVQEAGR